MVKMGSKPKVLSHHEENIFKQEVCMRIIINRDEKITVGKGMNYSRFHDFLPDYIHFEYKHSSVEIFQIQVFGVGINSNGISCNLNGQMDNSIWNKGD